MSADGSSLRDALRSVPAFRDLPDGVLDELARSVRWRRLRRGDVVFQEGAPVEV